MRICHVAPELLPVPPSRGGAIERWIRDAAVRLVGRGHELHVISRDHGDGRSGAVIDGVHYHFIPVAPAIERGMAAVMFRGLMHYRRAKALLRSIGPDIVHHHSRPAGLAISRGGAPRAAHLISLHSMDYGWSFGWAHWDRRLFNRGFAGAARVLSVSNFIRDHCQKLWPAMRGKSQTVYNGVDGSLFRPLSAESRGAAGSSDDAPILYVGRIDARKGVLSLVDAFEDVIGKQRPRSRLRIVGPHSYWDTEPSLYYRSLVDRCAANPRIELRGPTYDDAELAALYREAAVSVVPSVFPEALGLTSLEAQASGVPVVVSDAGGLPETVDAGKSGLVYDKRSIDQLGEAVLSILGNEQRRRAMGAAAREWAMRTFSWDVIAAQLEQTYTEAVGR